MSQACIGCGTPVPEHTIFGTAPDGSRWHKHDWTCRHGATWECHECYTRPRPEPTVLFCKKEYLDSARKLLQKPYPWCPVCGCGEEYT